MLKTNTKKARANVQKFIVDNCINYDGDNFTTVKEVCLYIYNCFCDECYNTDNRRYRMSKQQLFNEWATGCPSGSLFDYYLYKEDYHPINLLGDILEETEEERNRYKEEDSATILTYLIYREIERQITGYRG